MAALVCCEDAGTKFATDGAITKLLTGTKLVSGGPANFNAGVPRGDLLLALAATQQQQLVSDFSTTKRSRQQRRGFLRDSNSHRTESPQLAMQPGAFAINSAAPFVHNLQESRRRIPQQVRAQVTSTHHLHCCGRCGPFMLWFHIAVHSCHRTVLCVFYFLCRPVRGRSTFTWSA